MEKTTNIFYASGRSDRAVREFCKSRGIVISKHATGVDLIFIDPDNSSREELQAVLAKCRPNVVVYLIQLSDLGQGAKARQIRKRIEATGAKVVVPEKVHAKRGPKPSWKDLTKEQVEDCRSDYEKDVVSQQFICDKFLRKTGIKVTRWQLVNIFAKKFT